MKLILLILAILPAPSFGSPGEGIFAIDLKTHQVSRLAEYKNVNPNPNAQIGMLKYSILKNKNGSFNFAFQSDGEGSLYQFTASFDENGIQSTNPQILVHRADDYSVIGPAFCQAQNKLTFGKLFTDRADVRSFPLGSPAEKIEFSKPLMVAADLTCGNLDQGQVFLLMDCQDSPNIWECLGKGKGQALSSIHLSLPGKKRTIRLTSPETDSRVLNSPRRAQVTPLGDNGPWIHIDRKGQRHLTFARLHTTPEMFTNSKMPGDLKDGGFDVLYYKSLSGNPLRNPEYEIDFSAWLPRPALHSTILSSQLLDDPQHPGHLRLAVTGLFRTPNPKTGYDEEVYNGIVISSFDPQKLSKAGNNRILLGPAQTQGVLSGPELTCRFWDMYGIAPDGNVSVYIPFFPYFLDRADGHPFITFSTMKGLFGKWVDGKIRAVNGSILSESELRKLVCGKTHH